MKHNRYYCLAIESNRIDELVCVWITLHEPNRKFIKKKFFTPEFEAVEIWIWTQTNKYIVYIDSKFDDEAVKQTERKRRTNESINDSLALSENRKRIYLCTNMYKTRMNPTWNTSRLWGDCEKLAQIEKRERKKSLKPNGHQ